MIEQVENNPALLALVIPGLWIFMSFMLSLIGGWRALSDNYLADGPFEGSNRAWQSISVYYFVFYPVSYGNMVTMGASDKLVNLSVWFPFRLFHPPISIPYSEMRGVERRILFIKTIVIRAEKNPNVKIGISKKQADWIEIQSSGTWSYQRL